MNLTNLSYQLAENGIAIITIDVKDRPMNILTPELHQDVANIAEQLRLDDKAIGAVIQSGKSTFVAGGDLKRIVGLYDLNRTAEQAYLQSRTFTEALRKLETCGKAVACAINGTALGGGLELALACHYRVVVNNPKLLLGLPETSVGLMPGAGGTQRLPRLIGIKEAAELILSGRHIGPQRALELGIVNQLVDAEHLLSEAMRWILEEGDAVQAWDKKGFQIPGGSTLNNPKIAKLCQDLTTQVAVTTRYNFPAPIAVLKTIINGTSVSSFDTALKIETREFSKLTRGAVARNMMRTLFLNKGNADRLDKRPGKIDKIKINQLAILGDSSESSSLAMICATAGINVTAISETRDKDDKSLFTAVKELLDQRIESGRMVSEKADTILSHIKTNNNLDVLAQLDVLMINTRVDAKILSKHLANISDITIITVDTSKLSLTEVSAIVTDSKRVVGWHINYPADRIQAVEIVMSKNTSEETLAHVLDFTHQLRKTPLIQQEHATPFSQACITAFLEEALQMLSDGVNPILIENAARDVGMPQGPLELIDELSLAKVLKFVKEKSIAAKVLRSMLEQHGRKGMFEGTGFYNYSGDKGKRIWQKLSEQFVMQAEQPDVDQLKQRFLNIQSLQAVSYWQSDLIDIVDADIASVLIWGFPAYTGGVLSYIDTMGIRSFIQQCEQLADKYGPRYKVSDWLYEKAKVSDRIYTEAA